MLNDLPSQTDYQPATTCGSLSRSRTRQSTRTLRDKAAQHRCLPRWASPTARCLESHNLVNVIVSDKQNHLQYLPKDDAIVHCEKGIGIWDWASNDEGASPIS